MKQADYLIQGYRKGLRQALVTSAVARLEVELKLEATAIELVHFFVIIVKVLLPTPCRYEQAQASLGHYIHQG